MGKQGYRSAGRSMANASGGGETNSSDFSHDLEQIIVHGDSKSLVKVARDVAGRILSVSTSQIRNIYGTSKKVEMGLDKTNASVSYNKLILLKPKMEYAKGRANKKSEKEALSVLVKCLSEAIDLIDGKQDRMRNFFNFFEAILAYHRAEGGK